MRLCSAGHAEAARLAQVVLHPELIAQMDIRLIMLQVQAVVKHSPAVLRDQSLDGGATVLLIARRHKEDPLGRAFAECPAAEVPSHGEVDADHDRQAGETGQVRSDRIAVLLVTVDEIDPVATHDLSQLPER